MLLTDWDSLRSPQDSPYRTVWMLEVVMPHRLDSVQIFAALQACVSGGDFMGHVFSSVLIHGAAITNEVDNILMAQTETPLTD